MELHGYTPGVKPAQHVLLTRTEVSLALILDRTTTPLCGFDIHLLRNAALDPGWLDPGVKVDAELEDFMIDLDVAGFRTSECCRGKLCADETLHLDAAYVAFSEYLPDDLSAACMNAGLHCTIVSADALRQTPTLNFRSRISPWIRGGSRAPAPLTAEQLGLNAAFPDVVRQVWGTRLPRRSAMVRQLAEAAARAAR